MNEHVAFPEKVTVIALFILAAATTLTSAIFFVSALLPSASLALITYSVLLLALLGFVAAAYKYSLLRIFKALPVDYFAVGVAVITLIVFIVLGPKLLFEHQGGLATSVSNAYGDLGWHVATISSLGEYRTLTPPNPIFAGKALAYPFLANFLSTVLTTLGLSLPASVMLPTVVMLPTMCILLYAAAKKLTNSSWVGIVVLLFFLLGGGTLGWLRLHQGFGGQVRPVVDLSGNSSDPDGFYFLNPIISLLLPERAFVFGFALAFAILLLLLQRRRWAYLTAGILAGLLPFFHVHTVMALVPAIIAIWAMSPRDRAWRDFTGPALILGLPEVLYYVFALAGQPSGISWHVGWMFDSGFTGWLWGWLKNTGLVFPLAIVGLFLPPPPPHSRGLPLGKGEQQDVVSHSMLPSLTQPTPRLRLAQQGKEAGLPAEALAKAGRVLALAGLFLFALGNVAQFAPWSWDNIKLLIYAYLFCLPLAVSVLWRLPKPLVALVVIGHIIAGTHDVARIASPAAPKYTIWSAESVAFAEAVQQNTPPDAVILNASTFNSPIALTGRTMYLGYPAHVWTHGGNPWLRETAVKAFYAGKESTIPGEAPWPRGPKGFTGLYGVVGPQERAMYGHITVQPSWKLIVSSGGYALYQL